MEKKVLSETDIYYGTIPSPYGFKIDRTQIKYDILFSSDDKNRLANTRHIPLETNKYIIYPSIQRYYISKNISTQHNFFFCSNYCYERTS